MLRILAPLLLLASADALRLPTRLSRRDVGSALTISAAGLGSAACTLLLPRSALASVEAKAKLRETSAAREAAEALAETTGAKLVKARADLEQVVKILETNQDWVGIRRLLAAKPGVGDLRTYANEQAAAKPAKAGAIAAAKKAALAAIFIVDKKAYERQVEEITRYEVR